MRSAAAGCEASGWGRAERLIERSRGGGAEEGGAQEGEVASTAGVAAEFPVFAPSDITVVMVGAFDAPATAAAREPWAAGERAALKLGEKRFSPLTAPVFCRWCRC